MPGKNGLCIATSLNCCGASPPTPTEIHVLLRGTCLSELRSTAGAAAAALVAAGAVVGTGAVVGLAAAAAVGAAGAVVGAAGACVGAAPGLAALGGAGGPVPLAPPPRAPPPHAP